MSIITKLRDVWIAFNGDPSKDGELYKRYSSTKPFLPSLPSEEVMRLKEARFVRMRPIKELVRGKIINITHMSDDGEFMRFKVCGVEGVEHGMWVPRDKMLLVDCETIHVNMVKFHPQLFVEANEPEEPAT